MKLKVTVYPFKRLARFAGGAALDAVSVLQEGAAAAGRQAEEVLSRVRLEREVRDLREEIDLQMQAVGEILYASHRGDVSGQGKVEEILEYVDGLNEELEAHRREQETLRGLIVCSACGEANGANCLYCQNCGKPLSRP